MTPFFYILSVLVSFAVYWYYYLPVIKESGEPVAMKVGWNTAYVMYCFIPVANIFLAGVILLISYGPDFLDWIDSWKIWDKIGFKPMQNR